MSRNLASSGPDQVAYNNINQGVTGPWTVACWVKQTTTHAFGRAIISYGDDTNDRGWMLSVTAGNVPEARIIVSGGSYQQTVGVTTITTGTWFHLAAVRIGSGTSNLNVYVNAVQDGSGNKSAGIAQDAADDFLIGSAWPGDGTSRQPWNGDVAEVYYWNGVALSVDELAAVMKGSGHTIQRSALKLYAPLWGHHSPEIELTGLGITGTLTNTTASNHPPVSTFTPKWAATMPLIEEAGGGSGSVFASRVFGGY